MYDGPGLSDPADEDRFDSELERTEEEVQSAFLKFWDDVVPELERFGKIEALTICRSASNPHLISLILIPLKQPRSSPPRQRPRLFQKSS